MKQFLLFIAVAFAYILMPKNASAQYKSIFGDSTTSWNIIEQCSIEGWISDSFYVVKDTLVKGIIWKKLMRNNPFIKKPLFGGVIREDTVTGRVWYNNFNPYDSLDKLVMDLSLQLNDTFRFYRYNNREIKGYVIVDSVYLENGLKHIRFLNKLDNCSGKDRGKFQFIESKGTNAGFMYIADKDEVNGYMLCQFKDGIKTYSSTGYNGACREYGVGIENKNKILGDLKLYPNPTQGNGIITFPNNKNTCVNLYIYDLNGKQVYSNSANTTYISFDINASEKGIYIYKLQNEKGEFASGRIVKQ